MRTVRRAVTAMMLTPVMSGAAIIALAGPAAADTYVTSPRDGSVFSGTAPITIRAYVDTGRKGELFLKGPADSRSYQVDAGSRSLSYTLRPNCPTYRGTSCVGPAHNGTYVVTLHSSLLLLRRKDDEQTFRLRIPPAMPRGVAASLKAPNKIVIVWRKGAEPDLTRYEVFSDAGGSLGTVSVRDACSGSSCAGTVSAPAAMASRTVQFWVKAFRRVAPGSSSTLGSVPSERVRLTIPASTIPAPVTREGTPGPVAKPAKPAKLPGLDPLSTTSPLALPEVAGGGQFAYPAAPGGPGDPSVKTNPQGSPSQPSARAATVFGLQPQDVGRSAAIALILLLVLAHVTTLMLRRRPAAATSRIAHVTTLMFLRRSAAATAGIGRRLRAIRTYHGRRRRVA